MKKENKTDKTEDILMYVVLGIAGFILLILAFAVIHDTRPECWFSRAPFVCERVYKLEGE